MKEAETKVAATTIAVSPSLQGHDRQQEPSATPSSSVEVNTRSLTAGDCEHGYSGEGTAGRGELPNGNARTRSVGDNDLASSLVEGVGNQTREEPWEMGQQGGGDSIDMEDLEAALKGFSAESLRGAGLFRSSVEWGDVGGLRGVRAELREILEVCEAVLRQT